MCTAALPESAVILILRTTLAQERDARGVPAARAAESCSGGAKRKTPRQALNACENRVDAHCQAPVPPGRS